MSYLTNNVRKKQGCDNLLAIVNCCSLKGLDGQIVRVEVDVSNGLPSFEIVGLPNISVRESKERVRTAIKNSGLTFPLQRITVNLAPAYLKKEGSHFDVAIAVGILAATNQVAKSKLIDHVFIGELSLDGSILDVNGVLALADVISASPNEKFKLISSKNNAIEASVIKNLETKYCKNLSELLLYLNEKTELKHITSFSSENVSHSIDFADIFGQEEAKRAIKIAVAGSHNILKLRYTTQINFSYYLYKDASEISW